MPVLSNQHENAGRPGKPASLIEAEQDCSANRHFALLCSLMEGSAGGDKQFEHLVDKILRVNTELSRIKDLDLLLERFLYRARRESGADAGTIYVRRNDKLEFKYTQNDTLQARLGNGQKLPYSAFSVPIGDKSIAGFAAKHKRVLNIPDMYAIDKEASYHFDPSFDKSTNYRTVSSLTIPLISSDGELLGVMQLLNTRSEDGKFIPFSGEDESFYKMLCLIGTNAIQRAQMTRNLLITITGFAGLRDPRETAAHVNRVGTYAIEIYEAWAKQRKMTPGDIDKSKDDLRIAAMLHDVGKIGISDTILKKKSLFDASERGIMESHTWLGARQFLGETDLDLAAKEVALSHHENWDGSGYPGISASRIETEKSLDEKLPGLRGSDIPQFARIVAIADVYDALHSNRVYKDAWTEERVIETMKNDRGKKFDPELFDVFLRILPALRDIRQRFPDPKQHSG